MRPLPQAVAGRAEHRRRKPLSSTMRVAKLEDPVGHNPITEDVTTFGPVNALLSMSGLPSAAPIDGVAVPSALDRVVLGTAC